MSGKKFWDSKEIDAADSRAAMMRSLDKYKEELEARGVNVKKIQNDLYQAQIQFFNTLCDRFGIKEKL